MNKKILLVDDDVNMTFLLQENLVMENYETVVCANGEEALQAFHDRYFDLCILDVMMPRMDGFALADHIRKTNKNVPILFLTARNQIADKIQGFKTGADDYITKPFSLKELLLRIKAVLKRSSNGMSAPDLNEFKQVGNMMFNYTFRKLRIGKNELDLSAKEAELLWLLTENLNNLVQRQVILKKIWGDDDIFSSRSLDVYLTKLRKHINNDPLLILQNVHGVGYKLLVKDE